MSTETIHLSRRIALVGLCLAILFSSALILSPAVGAASDTNKTETSIEENNNITASAEDALLTQRAITIDEAKKEAQQVVSEQLAIIEAAKKAEAEATESEEAQSQTSSDDDSEEAYVETEYETSAETSSSTEEEDQDDGSAVQASYLSGYLMDIDNPDPGYTAYSVTLSDADRDITERMLMGEAGGMGFTGMALVAQCMRDTYVSGNYSSMRQLFYANGYYGSTSITPSETAKEVVNYIFDQGGSAVQHTIRIFYASNYCTSAWHEAQDYVCSYGYVRFFDF